MQAEGVRKLSLHNVHMRHCVASARRRRVVKVVPHIIVVVVVVVAEGGIRGVAAARLEDEVTGHVARDDAQVEDTWVAMPCGRLVRRTFKYSPVSK